MMLKFIKKILGITKLEYENTILRNELFLHKKFVSEKVSSLRAYTRVDADVGFRGNNTIVLTGVYRKTGFVRFYDVGDGEFMRLVDMMKDMKDHALIRNIDSPPDFHGVFDL